MKDYFQTMLMAFEQKANPAVAKAMAEYMRNQFTFFGIKAPLRREIQRSFLAKYSFPTIAQLPELMDLMWADEHREIQLFALDIMDKMIKKVNSDFIEVLEKLIITKSWWDTVDLLAIRLVGSLLKKYPQMIPSYPNKWMLSGNIWLQRTALLFQLKYKQATNTQLLFQYILELKDSKEFFIQKGAGWALREYSKTNPSMVIDFISEHNLAPLTKREGLKWLKKK